MTELADLAAELRRIAARLQALDSTPTPPPAPTPTPTPTPVAVVDARLSARGVRISAPATSSFVLVSARFLDVAEAQGRHHILLDVLDETGRREVGVQALVVWAGGATALRTEAKPGDIAAANFPMYASGAAYTLHFVDWRITGMGLGTPEQPNVGHHVCYLFVFRRK